MKPHLLKIPKEAGHSFSVRYDVVSFFTTNGIIIPNSNWFISLRASGDNSSVTVFIILKTTI
jgi:hypothetical protein